MHLDMVINKAWGCINSIDRMLPVMSLTSSVSMIANGRASERNLQWYSPFIKLAIVNCTKSKFKLHKCTFVHIHNIRIQCTFGALDSYKRPIGRSIYPCDATSYKPPPQWRTPTRGRRGWTRGFEGGLEPFRAQLLGQFEYAGQRTHHIYNFWARSRISDFSLTLLASPHSAYRKLECVCSRLEVFVLILCTVSNLSVSACITFHLRKAGKDLKTDLKYDLGAVSSSSSLLFVLDSLRSGLCRHNTRESVYSRSVDLSFRVTIHLPAQLTNTHSSSANSNLPYA